MGITQWFMDGGQFMYLIVGALFVSMSIVIAAGVSCRPSDKRTFIKITFFFALIPTAVGALGSYVSYVQLMTAVPMVDPEIKQEIYDSAMPVVRRPVIFGGLCSALLLVMWFISLKICKTK